MNVEIGLGHNSDVSESKNHKYSDIMDALVDGEFDEVASMLDSADLTEAEEKKEIVEMLYSVAHDNPHRIHEYMERFSLREGDISSEDLIDSIKDGLINTNGYLDSPGDEHELRWIEEKIKVAKKYGIENPESLIVDDEYVFEAIFDFFLNGSIKRAEELINLFGLTKNALKEEAARRFEGLIIDAVEPEAEKFKEFAEYFDIDLDALQSTIARRYIKLKEDSYLKDRAEMLKRLYGLSESEIKRAEEDHYGVPDDEDEGF